MAVTPRQINGATAHSAAVVCAAGWLAVTVLAAAPAGTALAQTSPAPGGNAASAPPPPASAVPPAASGVILPPQPPPPAPAAEQRGFLNGLGTWWNQSVADWKAKMKAQQTKLDEFNKQSADAAKDAATATQQAMKSAADALRPSHVIEIQQTCPIAGNGAADCATAATSACRTKGFSTGQPLDVRTAEKCADSLWVSGQAPTAADCPVETVLLRAACQ